MQGIIQYFINNSIAANLLMVAIFIMGVFGLLNMKSTFFPEVESRIISVQAIYPGASPEEIEEGVINKIEENLKGLTGVERYTSVSKENAGTVTVEVLRGYDTDVVLQDVKNAVNSIVSFPVGLETPVIYKLENLGFAISFAISGNVDLKTLKSFGRTAENDLRAIDGISKVELSGFPDEEIEIAFRERDLRAYNLTFQQAAAAVRAENLEITGGTIKTDNEELLVRARNKAYYAEGLRDIVMKSNPNGSVVRLSQIADIKDQWAENSPNRVYQNGKPAVVVTVQNTLEEDMITITDLVREYMEEFNAENEVVEATVVRDGSIVLRQRMALLTENGLLGFGIVLVLLAMFLHWRLAFWVALAIPISFAGMFVCAWLLDVTLNVVSLFGMILVIGILVDDGIVIAESIYQQYEKGVPRYEAAVKGTMAVLPAVFSAIITTIFAFSTFLLLDGRLGDIFTEMSLVIIFSLIFSLIEGALILPPHVAHSKALEPDAKPNKVQAALDRGLFWVRDKFYAPVLRFAMYNKLLTFGALVAVLFMSFGMVGGGMVGTTFFPVIEGDDVNVTLQMPAGTREHVTNKWLTHIEEAAWEVNEELSEKYYGSEMDLILKVQRTVGPTTYQGNLAITLLDGETRGEVKAREVSNAIRERAGEIAGAEVVTYGARNTFGKPISVSLVGNNYEELSAATETLKARMSQLTELTDVVDNNQEGLREVNVTLKEKARYLGLNVQDILAQVRAGFFGSEVQRLQRGRDEVRVWVRYDETDRDNLEALADMRVRFLDGREFPLSEVVNLDTERGVISINHIDGRREVKVEADIANDQVSVADITENIKTEMVPDVLKDYPSVSALYEGQNREQVKTAESMGKILPVILALMFFSIALTFKSITQTISVFLLIPFCFIGVIWGHWLNAAPISLFSALGVIALIGILVNDALVLVTTYNSLLAEGKQQMAAIYEAGLSRFRPIVLTTVTTFAGLAPLLFETSLQAQFLIPMAIAVSFGLLVITVIILVLLPVYLITFNRLKVYGKKAWNGVKPTYEEVENAARVQNV